VHESHLTSMFNSLRKLLFFGTLFSPVIEDLNGGWSSSSDSEYSEDWEQEEERDRVGAWKIRLHTLEVFYSLSKVCGKGFYKFWPLLLPTRPQPLHPTLFTSLLHDSSIKVRSYAGSLICCIFEGTSSYLDLANDRWNFAFFFSHSHCVSRPPKRIPSFMPLSLTLGSIIRESHHCLLSAMDTELRGKVKLHLLKLISVLAQNVHYEKLSPGYLAPLLSRLHVIIFEEKETEENIKIAALESLESILSIKTPLKEIEKELDSPNSLSLLPSFISAIQSPLPPAIRANILKCISATIKSYFPLFVTHWNSILPIVMKKTKSKDPASRVASIMVLEGCVFISLLSLSSFLFFFLFRNCKGTSIFSASFSSFDTLFILGGNLIFRVNNRLSRFSRSCSCCHFFFLLPNPAFRIR